jgi:hypothetical protein
MTTVKKFLLVATAISVTIVTTTAEAKTCLIAGDESSTTIVLSGRITTKFKIPKDPDLRATNFPVLILDTPFQIDYEESGCQNVTEVSLIDPTEKKVLHLKKMDKRHVTVSGELGRPGTALVVPSIFVEVKSVK